MKKHPKTVKSEKPCKNFATPQEVKKATSKALNQYQEAIKKLADR